MKAPPLNMERSVNYEIIELPAICHDGTCPVVFTIGRADAGMTEKSMKQDEMKKNTWNSKICRSKP